MQLRTALVHSKFVLFTKNREDQLPLFVGFYSIYFHLSQDNPDTTLTPQVFVEPPVTMSNCKIIANN